MRAASKIWSRTGISGKEPAAPDLRLRAGQKRRRSRPCLDGAAKARSLARFIRRRLAGIQSTLAPRATRVPAAWLVSPNVPFICDGAPSIYDLCHASHGARRTSDGVCWRQGQDRSQWLCLRLLGTSWLKKIALRPGLTFLHLLRRLSSPGRRIPAAAIHRVTPMRAGRRIPTAASTHRKRIAASTALLPGLLVCKLLQVPQSNAEQTRALSNNMLTELARKPDLATFSSAGVPYIMCWNHWSWAGVSNERSRQRSITSSMVFHTGSVAERP